MKKIVIILVMIFYTTVVSAQRAAISVDAVKAVMAVPNISVDILLSDRFTLNVETIINPFEDTYKNLRTKQVTLTPELRYWFKRPLYSHFLGVNLMGSIYDVGHRDTRYNGRVAAIGAVYGYSIYLGPRWSLTPTIGIGYGYGDNTTFKKGIQTKYDKGSWKPVMTKFGFYLTYIIN